METFPQPVPENVSRADCMRVDVDQGFGSEAGASELLSPLAGLTPWGPLRRGFSQPEGRQSWLVPLSLGEVSGRQGGLPQGP